MARFLRPGRWRAHCAQPVERLLQRVGHPSFTEDLARRLVSDLDRAQLRGAWTASGRALVDPLSLRTRLNLVIIRAALLDALLPAIPGPALVTACDLLLDEQP